MIPQNFENQKAHKQEDLKKTEYMPFRPAKKFLSLQARLLNAIEQSVIATDLDGIVIYWNRFAEQLYGWSAEEAIGRQIIKLTTPKPPSGKQTRLWLSCVRAKAGPESF